MNILLALIPLSFVLLLLAVWAFFWAVNHAQFDDLESPALSPLVDDRPSRPRAPESPPST
ncbi:cbb3-type cytochrome oxidase assembly protein CcoS [Tahibacter amnicola]|uniref:Cbb3-type cytochrome oxidase assembly protein CcoS n=1 Tax=Tahibacter amnicola TaxID=2976241 RepID=A0ABY6B9C5_9GAMM|nr:cbb3-type cytochrome oxidase assembly protein CcoS [Tahibacter amnicola]UXI66479.1 cbb3-type cytochrome oxidase assembly protein CcoS [Tahibacter amnicola]